MTHENDDAIPAAPSRRGFLAVAGAASAGVAGAAVLGGAAARAESTDPDKRAALAVPDGTDGPLVVFVRDAHTGELAVLNGEKEVVVHDRDLAARIAHVAAHAAAATDES